ncbi:hypothetical protein [Psychromonas aquimarina]|uniref:hypothetical protein n=1 Tax=Psychromonas aquimarina TaxID=444919 RepID=UPI0004256B2B|nr:hypothetical protein [Psychromonas aquimarina]
MIKRLNFLKSKVTRGTDILVPLAAVFFKNILFLFLPQEADLNNHASEPDNEKEIYDISLQWSELWSRVSEQCFTAKRCRAHSGNLNAQETHNSVVKLRCVKHALLTHIGNDSASSQMLSCYRNAGEPAFSFYLISCLTFSFQTIFLKAASRFTLSLQTITLNLISQLTTCFHITLLIIYPGRQSRFIKYLYHLVHLITACLAAPFSRQKNSTDTISIHNHPLLINNSSLRK